MPGIPPRRTTRTTRLVDQNAGQRTKPSTATSKDKTSTRETTSKPEKSTTTSAKSNPLGQKRKALGDNTNAEKKRIAEKDKHGKVIDKPQAKDKRKVRSRDEKVDAPGMGASTSLRMVVELPMRKRIKPTAKNIETAQATTTKPPLTKGPNPVPADQPSSERATRTTLRSHSSTVGSNPRPAPLRDVAPPKAKATKTRKARPELKPQPKLPSQSVAEPPAKRRRSNDQAPVPAVPPAIVEASNAVPLKEDDNPFEVGLQTADAGVIKDIKHPWDDLDAEDEYDPLMVAEYVVEIFEYMKELEIRTMPSSTYMNAQSDLDWSMRAILMDWLIQVHARFKLLPETLFLAANIIDRFLSLRVVSLVKLQLVGITALFTAAKYEEIMAPHLSHFLQVSDAEYGEEEILKAERYVLRTLNWDMSYPNPMSWLRRASKADQYDVHTRTLAKFFIEIGVVEHRLLKYTPSMLAAAGLWLARLILEKEDWDANLEHYSGYTERKIVPCANVMLNFVLEPKMTYESIWKKYSAKKYHKCAVYARKWAEQRWPPTESDEAEDQPVEVDLFAALPVLREQVRAIKAVRAAEGEMADD